MPTFLIVVVAALKCGCSPLRPWSSSRRRPAFVSTTRRTISPAASTWKVASASSRRFGNFWSTCARSFAVRSGRRNSGIAAAAQRRQRHVLRAGFARELEWIKPFTKVLEWHPPDAKWFADGTLNVSANCLDRHIRTWRRNKAAFIWEGEPGDTRTLTYAELHADASDFSGADGERLKGHLARQAGQGDRLDAGRLGRDGSLVAKAVRNPLSGFWSDVQVAKERHHLGVAGYLHHLCMVAPGSDHPGRRGHRSCRPPTRASMPACPSGTPRPPT